MFKKTEILVQQTKMAASSVRELKLFRQRLQIRRCPEDELTRCSLSWRTVEMIRTEETRVTESP